MTHDELSETTDSQHGAFATTGWRDLPVGLARSCGRREVGTVSGRVNNHLVGVYKALHTREARSLIERALKVQDKTVR